MFEGRSSKAVSQLGVGPVLDPPRTKRKHHKQSDMLPHGEVRDIIDVFGSSVVARDEDLMYLESLQEALTDFGNGKGARRQVSRKKAKQDTSCSSGFGPWPSAKQMALETGPSKRMHNHGLDDAPWPIARLLVRVVDENGPLHEHHLSKGVVIRTDATTGECNIKLRNGHILHSIPHTSLETVVGKDCRRVEIVQGQHRGVQAPLIFRDPKHNTATVRIGCLNDGLDVELSLDDICEFA